MKRATVLAAGAFTLVEMLVTLAVIAILAAVLMPALAKSKEAGRAAACLGNLHQIGLALQMYVDENHNRIPIMYDLTNAPAAPTNSIDTVLAAQLGSPRALLCPSDRQQLFELTRSSYGWNYLLNGQNADHMQLMGQLLPGTKVPVVFDKEDFHRALGSSRAVNFLYADGHMKSLLELPGTRPQ
ncbi:MAG TPA: DUF1559 domain-containing protein [Verrucomicrobiae bacterium]|jgi:prepilin-type N-terminal cleavage/methylation domain-containing protein/prepilin-type processing-associated H-X9-DG protein|nr:DUF1559 domain-containing protein [Verrucomicrobiae bacterium]